MHRKLFAFVFVAALLSSAVVVFADSDDSDATSVTTITGFVSIAGAPPPEEEHLEIYLTNATETCTPIHTTIGADGSFTLDLTTASAELQAETVFHIYFSDVDYVALSLPTIVDEIPGSQHLLLDLTSFAGTTCELGDSLIHSICLISGHGPLEFTVKGTDRFLLNAMISLEDVDESQEYSGETAANGKYTFTNLPYGEYNLKVTCNGYKTFYGNLTFNGQTTHSVTMVEKEIPTFYGMTTYHALMFLGVAVGLILVMISHILVKRNWKGMKD